MSSPHWPDPAKDYAFRLIGDGHSSTSIARMVNAAFPGLEKTRNAILGLAHRNDLHLRGGRGAAGGHKGGRPRKLHKSRRKPRKSFNFGKAPSLSDTLQAIRMVGTPLPPPHETDIARVSFVELDEDGHRHCKWPVGTVESIHAPLFCGAGRLPGACYCADHLRRAYQAPQPRRPAPAAPVPAEPKVLQAA